MGYYPSKTEYVTLTVIFMHENGYYQYINNILSITLKSDGLSENTNVIFKNLNSVIFG